jgi:hypothetical protein
VTVRAYLDLRRVSRDQPTLQQLLADPLGLRTYPLGFLASLITADLSGMRDGSLACPVVVLTAEGDELFSLAYTREVYERIVAPAKRLVVLESDRHLVLVESLDVALPVVLEALDDVLGTSA